jgi:hypothetical protein
MENKEIENKEKLENVLSKATVQTVFIEPFSRDSGNTFNDSSDCYTDKAGVVVLQDAIVAVNQGKMSYTSYAELASYIAKLYG